MSLIMNDMLAIKHEVNGCPLYLAGGGGGEGFKKKKNHPYLLWNKSTF